MYVIDLPEREPLQEALRGQGPREQSKLSSPVHGTSCCGPSNKLEGLQGSLDECQICHCFHPPVKKLQNLPKKWLFFNYFQQVTFKTEQ